MEIEIRKALESDLERITEIYNEALLNTAAHYYAEPKTLDDRRDWLLGHTSKYPVLVALINNKVIGWASLNRWSVYHAFEDSAESSLYVDTAYQGKGIGSKLMQHLIEETKKGDLKTIIARILDGNPASIKIHERAGFEHTGTLKKIGKKFGRYIDLHMMQKML